MNKTTDRSFFLKPSTNPNAGVGVFATHDIEKDTYLELFLEDFHEELVEVNSVPKLLRIFCIDQADGKALCPTNFNRLDIGNYLNHSIPKQNVYYKNGKGYFAQRDLVEGEELFANYQELGEPTETWEDYYTDGS